MSSQAVNYYDALATTTSVEDITDNEDNQGALRSLKNDELSSLWLVIQSMVAEHGDYVLGGNTELGWLGHFVKKSTRLDAFGISGGDALDNCSGHSVDRFLDDLSNLEQLYVDCELEDGHGFEDLNGDDMAECIPSLATCTGMRKLTLNGLNLSTNGCAALRVAFPRMAALIELSLCGNSIDDDCARVLTRGLSECKQLQSLNLRSNIISDDGLDVLIQGLPTSVDVLYLAGNEITLTQHLPLLRFKKLRLWGNALCPGGPRVIAESLANPQCRLEFLYLDRCNIGDEGVATLAEGLRNNQRLTLMSLESNNITERGWNEFSSILCDASSINATYNSNHVLRNLGGYGVRIPRYVQTMLRLNEDKEKSRVAANKILQVHRHLDMRPLLGRELDLLPYVVAWLERFAKSRPDLKLSSINEFVRAMPTKVIERMEGKTEGKKRKLNS
ncbi:hypothetical protein THAOC_32691 [Thalassiosira oceanica]|uniref:Uncharacterized protein n=1 Tax=Thalassiosira oceanica TaxID=159749 RepID=K0R5E6_THAOC|nr:hypothetical protein THAOC_32691 [Thalassiosira oceanica]|eukprot:EJK48503.1 hypothetical protein THAOC_32691 [Thalassiosira oceanica]